MRFVQQNTVLAHFDRQIGCLMSNECSVTASKADGASRHAVPLRQAVPDALRITFA